MSKLIVFNHVSLDGYFVDGGGAMSWAYQSEPDEEWDAYVAGNAQGGGTLLFGRVTYEMMASFWPTPAASQTNPVVAERMNSLKKVVFSKSLHKVSWQNTRLVNDDLVGEVTRMKAASQDGIAILGSGTIVSQLTAAGLIDEIQVVINPVVLGRGRTLFEGLKESRRLKLLSSRTFRNGNVVLCYEPVR